MKLLLSVSVMLVMTVSISAFAADLKIPMEFEYLALDGKKVKSNSFRHKSTLELNQGTHKIAIRYNDLVKDDFGDNRSFIKSSPFIITINIDGDHHYLLRPGEGKIIRNSKIFAKDPKVKISRSDNGPVSYQVFNTDWEEESFLSRLFSGNQTQDIAGNAATATNTGVSLAASGSATIAAETKADAVTATLPATVTEPHNANQTADANPQRMLQYCWLQADEKTRKEFMRWAFSQP